MSLKKRCLSRILRDLLNNSSQQHVYMSICKITFLIFLYEVHISASFLHDRIIHLFYTFLYNFVVLWVAIPMFWKKILPQTSGPSEINPDDRGRMFLRNVGIRQKHLYGATTQNTTLRTITDKQT